MASFLSFKLEETDDDYIIVNFEEEDARSKNIKLQEDKGVPLLDDGEIVNIEDALDDGEIVNFEDEYSKSIQQLEDMREDRLDDKEIVNFEDASSESTEEQEDICESQLDVDVFDLATCQNPDNFAISRKYLKQKKDYKIEDIVKEYVLTFLPAKSLCKCRAVSKEWERWISSPFFVHQHTLRFKSISGLFRQNPWGEPSFISLDSSAFGVRNPTLNFLPEHVYIRATSNGLLCCRGQSESYYICNPVTEEWKMLPDPSLYHAQETGLALVFEPSTFNFGSHYELIAAVQLPDTSFLFFEIYSSRTNSWRISETVCYESSAGETTGDGFYTRGYAYWEMKSGFILAFNVIHEQYGLISLPQCSSPVGTLMEMKGHLCYLFPRVHYNSYNIEVYGTMRMMLEHEILINGDTVGDIDPVDGFCRAVCSVNDDMLIIELGSQIMAYDIKNQTSQRLSSRRTGSFSKYLPYVNSLVPVASPVD